MMLIRYNDVFDVSYENESCERCCTVDKKNWPISARRPLMSSVGGNGDMIAKSFELGRRMIVIRLGKRKMPYNIVSEPSYDQIFVSW